MRFLILLAALPLCAQIPAQDSRNTDLPGTNTHFQMREYKTRGEWQARRAALRRQVLAAAGLQPMPPKTPLHPQVFGKLERAGYSIEKVLIETLPGFWLGGNLYRPLGKSGPFPAVVSPHGHWNYGRLEATQEANVPARGIMLAKLGFVVFTIDMVGYNDTVQVPHVFGNPQEQLWGFGPLGLQLWNSIRAVDFLASLPDVDASRIGATGASGGGTQTFTLYAVDDRIAFAAPVNMISAIMQGGDFCENAPGLRLGTNNMEIGAMMAPRPMLMVAATGDWTVNTPREEYPAVQSIYRLFGAENKLEMVQIDAKHNYNRESREAVYRFFAKVAQGRQDADQIKESGVKMEKLQDMLALHGRPLPAGALTYEQLFAEWVKMAKRQNGEANRERLVAALHVEWPARVLHQSDGERVVLSRDGRGDRVAGILLRGVGTPAVVVHPDGAAAARQLPEVAELRRRGLPVLLLEVFQTGSAVAPRDRTPDHFLAFNQSDDANRVQDILTAAAFMGRGVELYGSGKAAIWCVFASAAAPEPLKVNAQVGAFEGSDDDFLRDCNIPGIQRAGGWRSALVLSGFKPVAK
jgi:dienelactone hydrolase